MDNLLSALSLSLSVIRLVLDKAKLPRASREDPNLREKIDNLGAAIRALEYALGETSAKLRGRIDGEPLGHDDRLSAIWLDASAKLRKLKDSAELSNITFEKSLYWNNPELRALRNNGKLYEISIENLLQLLRTLRSEYDRLIKKLDS